MGQIKEDIIRFTQGGAYSQGGRFDPLFHLDRRNDILGIVPVCAPSEWPESFVIDFEGICSIADENGVHNSSSGGH